MKTYGIVVSRTVADYYHVEAENKEEARKKALSGNEKPGRTKEIDWDVAEINEL